MTAQQELNSVAGFVIQYKELFATVGIVLGLIPRVIELARQATAAQKEQRAMSLQRQRLELMKLRYEVVEYEEKYGSAPALGAVSPPVTLEVPLPHASAGREAPTPAAPRTHTGAEARLSDALKQASVEEPKPPPAVVQWLINRPAFGKPVLWVLQASLLLLLLGSGFVTLVFPLSMLSDSSGFGSGSILMVEAIYILMTLAFWALYRKVGRWRTLPRSGG